VIAIVTDSSISMGFTNRDQANGQSRLNAASAGLRSIQPILQETFDTRSFSIDDQLKTLDSAQTLTPSGVRTNLAGGLSELLTQATAGELAAVVLLSDGGNNAEPMDLAWWNRLRQTSIPVHTVGVGPNQLSNDIEISEVLMPTQSAPNTDINIRVRIQHPVGLDTVRLRLKQGDDLRFADDIPLTVDASETIHEVSVSSGEAGVQALQFTLTSALSETNTVNNVVMWKVSRAGNLSSCVGR